MVASSDFGSFAAQNSPSLTKTRQYHGLEASISLSFVRDRWLFFSSRAYRVVIRPHKKHARLHYPENGARIFLFADSPQLRSGGSFCFNPTNLLFMERVKEATRRIEELKREIAE